MALKFKCEHCDSEIISNYLTIGESYECKDCKKRTKIPSDAEEVENTLLRRRRKLEELLSNSSIKIENNYELEEQKDDRVNIDKKDTKKSYPICKDCSIEQKNENALYCYECGSDLYPKEYKEIKICPKCDKKYDSSINYCDKDGKELIIDKIEISDWYDENFGNTSNTNSQQQSENESDKDLPMKWYKFITYLLFPLFIIIDLIFAIWISDSIITIPLLVGAVFVTILVYGLHNRTSWSWKLLLVSYLLSSLIGIIEILEDWGFLSDPLLVIFINAIITYSNYIYFKKRKHLFVN